HCNLFLIARANLSNHIYRVNLLHNIGSRTESCDDIHIMLNITHIQGATLTIFEPLLRWLVTTNIELPRDERYIGKVLRVINPYLTNAAVCLIRLETYAVFAHLASDAI